MTLFLHSCLGQHRRLGRQTAGCLRTGLSCDPWECWKLHDAASETKVDSPCSCMDKVMYVCSVHVHMCVCMDWTSFIPRLLWLLFASKQ